MLMVKQRTFLREDMNILTRGYGRMAGWYDESVTDLLKSIPEVDEALKRQTQSRIEHRSSPLQACIAMNQCAETGGCCFHDIPHN